MTYRNPKLTKLAKGKPCVSCGADDYTTVWAHSNLLEHGKGRGLKASDACGMLLCFKCHSELDQGNRMTKEEKRQFQIEMMVRTYRYLIENELLEVA